MQMLLTRRQPLATRTTLRRRALHSLFGLALLTGASSLGGAAPLPAQQEPAEIQRQADEIARLRAENSQLRADLAEMQVVLTDLRDLLTQLRADQEAERMDRKDGMLQKLVEDDQHEALRALGYLAVEEYVVREGDSLAKIVGKDAASDSEYLKTLQELNPNLLTSIRGGYRINLVPGQSLMLPRQKHSADPANPFQEAVEYTALIYVVQEGETVFDIALKHGLMSRDLQLLFYGLNADKFGSKVPDEMHAYQLKRGDTLRVPVANGDGEVVAQTTPEGLLKLKLLLPRRHRQDPRPRRTGRSGDPAHLLGPPDGRRPAGRPRAGRPRPGGRGCLHPAAEWRAGLGIRRGPDSVRPAAAAGSVPGRSGRFRRSASRRQPG